MISIGIPAAGRDTKLLNCIESIDLNTKADYEFIVIDNSKKSILKQGRLLKNDVKVIRPEMPLSPSASRELIGSVANSEYILYIDEDMTVSKDSIDQLLNFLKENSDVSIVGGLLIEGLYEYPVAYKFGFGGKTNQKNIWKIPIMKDSLSKIDIDNCESDFVHPPFLIRSEILNKVKFDKNFQWGSELFDFFLECFKKNIKTISLTNVSFFHFPGEYLESTHKSINANKNGRKYFLEKWNLNIVSPNTSLLTYLRERLIKKFWFNIVRKK